MTTERANAIIVYAKLALLIVLLAGWWLLSGSSAYSEIGIKDNTATVAIAKKLQDAVAENGEAIERLSRQLAAHDAGTKH